jgi:O-antigen ligase/polysaccharide polymerase Wzy-like membrane protein
LDPATAHIGAICGGLGAILAVAGRGRVPLLMGIVLLAGGAAALGSSLSGGGGLSNASTGALAGLGALGVVALVAAAWALVRWPGATAPALLAAAPFRLPISFDSSKPLLIATAKAGQLGRLLPLYFVLVAAVLALVWRILRRDEGSALPRMVALPAAAFLAFACASLLWTDDLNAGAQLLTFFLLPFAALLAVLGRAEYPQKVLKALAVVGVALASIFAVVGLVEAATHRLLFFAPNLELSNENSRYFRVTSLFGDPSLYGRHVVLGISILLVLLALNRIRALYAIPLIALLWAGLFFSYSQSSMAALVIVTLAIAAVTGGRRVRLAVALVAGILLVAGAGVVAATAIQKGSLQKVTSDRSRRIEDTARVIGKHPLVGVGIGAQPRVSQRLSNRDAPTPDFVSHTAPLTVAAELGAVGLALYALLLVNGARLIAAVHRRQEALGLALGAAFLALFVHALFYSGFNEDPITWVVLGVASGYLVAAGAVDGGGRLSDRSRRAAEPAAEPAG